MPKFSPLKRQFLRRATAPAAAVALRYAAAASLGVPWAAAAQAKPGVVRIAAASDLKFALASVLAPFELKTGIKVELNFGSSGNFARQILQGLPVDIFMSADEDWVFKLADAGLSLGRGVVYARGRLALLVPAQSEISLDTNLQGLRNHWSKVRKLAIANPELAPYGRAAQQALQKLQLWDQAQAKLVVGESIAQTTQFVTSGAAQAGISAMSLALAAPVAALTRHIALPESLHAALQQRMVLLRKASPQAQELYQYLQTHTVKTQWSMHGLMAS